MINFRAIFLTFFAFAFLPCIYGMEESATETPAQSLEEELEKFREEQAKYAVPKKQEAVQTKLEEAGKAQTEEEILIKEEAMARLTKEQLQKIYEKGRENIEKARLKEKEQYQEKQEEPDIRSRWLNFRLNFINLLSTGLPDPSPLGRRLLDAIESYQGDPNAKLPKDLLAEFIAGGGDIDEPNFKDLGRTALRLAAAHHSVSIVAQLIEAGADVNILDGLGTTPLYAALTPFGLSRSENAYKTVLTLINAGADVTRAVFGDQSPLDQIASEVRSYREWDTPLWMAKMWQLIFRANVLQTGSLVLFGERNLAFSKERFFDRALNAISDFSQGRYYNLERLQNELEAHRSFINEQDDLGATLLMYAAALGQKDIVKILLDLGANPFIKTKAGQNVFTILKHIVTKKKQEMDKEKIEKYERIMNMLEMRITKKYLVPLLSAKPEYRVKDTTKVLSPKYHMPPEILAQIYSHLVEPASQAKPKEAVVAPLETTSGDGFIIPSSPPVVPVPDIGRQFGQPTPQSQPTQPAKPEWKKPFAWAAGTAFAALLARLGYDLTYTEAPSNLNEQILHAQLITALANKKYDYALQLAQNNPQAMRDLVADTEAKEDLVEAIRKAEAVILDEVATEASLNTFQRLWRPSVAAQLKQLASLVQLLK